MSAVIMLAFLIAITKEIVFVDIGPVTGHQDPYQSHSSFSLE